MCKSVLSVCITVCRVYSARGGHEWVLEALGLVLLLKAQVVMQALVIKPGASEKAASVLNH